jgi:hypothetical protein
MTDFRALCTELVELLEVSEEWSGCTQPQALTRAHAALAEQPVGATDEELEEFTVFWWGSDTDELTVTDVIECFSMAAFARAVLAKWKQP